MIDFKEGWQPPRMDSQTLLFLSRRIDLQALTSMDILIKRFFLFFHSDVPRGKLTSIWGRIRKEKKLQNRLNIFVSASSQISMTLVQKVPAIENQKMLYLQLRSTMYNIFYTVILSQIKTWVYIFSKQPCIWYTQSQKIQFSDVHIICRSLNEVSEIFQKIFLGE